MNLPSPTDPKAWPPFARLLAWGALASAALLLIGAGLSQVAAVASAQGGLLSALVAGWLLATLADAEDLRAAFSHHEGYLHQGDRGEAVDMTLEYSRPFRALKFWLAFRAHGAAQFRAAIERNMAEAALLARAVRLHDDLELLDEPQLSVVPFRHLPPGGGDIDAHNKEIARRLVADGRVYVASATIDGAVYQRPCFVNFRTSDDDVLALVDVVRELGTR